MAGVASKCGPVSLRLLKKCDRIFQRKHCGCGQKLTDFIKNHTCVNALMIQVVYLHSRRKKFDADLKSLRELGYEMMTAEEISKDFKSKIDDDEQKAMENLLPLESRHVVVFKTEKDKQKSIFVAIRGTNMLSWKDLMEDLKIAFETIHCGDRVGKIERLVDLLARVYGNEFVTITGHSLGATVGYCIERKLYLKNRESNNPHLQLGHYFNLPFLPLDRVLLYFLSRFKVEFMPLRKANLSERCLKKFANLSERCWKKFANILGLSSGSNDGFMNEFNNLKDWFPNVYVQEHDTICQGIVNYFQHRSTGDCGLPNTSFTPMLARFSAKPLHHFPSVRLIITNNGVETVTSHGISNWTGTECCRVRVERYRDLERTEDT